MKLQPLTLSILKNFALINNGIWIKAGSSLSTVSPQKTILGTATIPDTFPVDFGVYDLNRFLSVLSLHKDNAEFEFDQHHVLIGGKSGRSQVKYRFTDKKMLTIPPDKKITLPSIDIEFVLEEDDYNWVMNAAKVLQSPNISVRSDGKKISLVSFDAKDDSASTQSLEITDGNGIAFDMIFLTDNLNKIIPDAYNVKISSSKVSFFETDNKALNYFIALEDISKYN